MQPRAKFPVLAAAWVVAAAGCSLPQELAGSISQDYSLEFDLLDLVQRDDLVRIDYIKDDGPIFGVSIPCRITVDSEDGELDGEPIEGDAFRENVEVSRLALAGGDFPNVSSGSITFTAYDLQAGEVVAGHFTVEFAEGRGLQGTFAQRLRLEVTP